MTMRRMILLACAGVLASLPGASIGSAELIYRPDPGTKIIVGLINAWALAGSACRSGGLSEPRIVQACAAQHRAWIELDDYGWCFGHESDPGPFFRRWHHCEAESIHPSRP